MIDLIYLRNVVEDALCHYLPQWREYLEERADLLKDAETNSAEWTERDRISRLLRK